MTQANYDTSMPNRNWNHLTVVQQVHSCLIGETTLICRLCLRTEWLNWVIGLENRGSSHLIGLHKIRKQVSFKLDETSLSLTDPSSHLNPWLMLLNFRDYDLTSRGEEEAYSVICSSLIAIVSAGAETQNILYWVISFSPPICSQ